MSHDPHDRGSAVPALARGASLGDDEDVDFGNRTVARVMRRLVPFLCLIYFVSFVDRVNVSFAAVTMNQALGLSATAFGFGTGVFFLGYVLFEIPSNLALRRVGAPRWIALIMAVWGICSAATAFAWNDWSFCVIRFLLGSAEAGLLPGVILYLTYWIPQAHRARILGLFMVAIALSGIIGAPLSGLLLQLDGTAGLAGWQWMFLTEASPALVLSLVTLLVLTDRPASATWLSQAERNWLQTTLDDEEASRVDASPQSTWGTLFTPQLWLLGLVNFGLLIGLYSINFWLPLIVRDAGFRTPISIGFVAALPALAGACGMILWSRHSDRHDEQPRHLMGSIGLAVLGFCGAAFFDYGPVTLGCLIVASLGIHASLPLFWAMPTKLLGGVASATGLALINSISNIGGYVGPQLLGYIKDQTAGFSVAFAIIAVAILATIPIVASFDRSFSGNAKRSRHPTIAVPLTEVDRHAGPIS